jgi:hypothetical protein
MEELFRPSVVRAGRLVVLFRPPEGNNQGPEVPNQPPATHAAGMEEFNQSLRTAAGALEVRYATPVVEVKWLGGNARFLFTMVQ